MPVVPVTLRKSRRFMRGSILAGGLSRPSVPPMNPRPFPTDQPSSWRLPIRREVAFALMGLGVVLALGCVFNASGVFFRPGTHADMLWQNGGYGILACGLTLVIIAGGI